MLTSVQRRVHRMTISQMLMLARKKTHHEWDITFLGSSNGVRTAGSGTYQGVLVPRYPRHCVDNLVQL